MVNAVEGFDSEMGRSAQTLGSLRLQYGCGASVGCCTGCRIRKRRG